MKETLTVKEVAELCKVQERTIRAWIRLGKLKAMLLGQAYRIVPEDVEGLLQPVMPRQGAPKDKGL